MTSFGRMMVLRIRVGFARARRAARNGERKSACSGGECGFIFYFALARGCARRARLAHRTGKPSPSRFPGRPGHRAVSLCFHRVMRVGSDFGAGLRPFGHAAKRRTQRVLESGLGVLRFTCHPLAAFPVRRFPWVCHRDCDPDGRGRPGVTSGSRRLWGRPCR